MRYFVTLNDREFPLRLERERGQLRLFSALGGGEAGERQLECELLAPARHGRPALVRVEGRVLRVLLEASAPGTERPRLASARIDGELLRVALETELERRARPAPSATRATGTRILAPMPGRVVKVNVSAGDVVAAGTPLLSVEAMKMENELQSPGAGRVLSVHVQVGATVESDQELVVLSSDP